MAISVTRVVGVEDVTLVEVAEAFKSGVEFCVCTSPAAPEALATSAADSSAAIAPAIIPTPPRRLPVALFPVATSRELAMTGVAGLDVLGCTSHAPPSESSRLPNLPEHCSGSELSRPFHPIRAFPPTRV